MALEELREASNLEEVNLDLIGEQFRSLRKNADAGPTIEEYLTLLSAKMDIGNSLSVLCESTVLMIELFRFVSDFANQEKSIPSFSTVSPISHRSYEYILFILLGIAEKAVALKAVVEAVDNTNPAILEGFFQSVGNIISTDKFYFTQEMALEVLGRISFLLHSNPDKVPRLKSLTSTLSVVIRTQLADKKSISILLRDMRPFLNKINESNVNIITFALSSVVLGDKTISDSSWLDISKTELFCFYSDKYDLYLKIPFNLVVSCVTAQPRVLEITVSSLPEMYRSIIHSTSSQQVFRVTFMDNEDVKECQRFFVAPELSQTREEDTISSLSSPEMQTEEQLLRGHKISITRASKRISMSKVTDTLLKLVNPSAEAATAPKRQKPSSPVKQPSEQSKEKSNLAGRRKQKSTRPSMKKSPPPQTNIEKERKQVDSPEIEEVFDTMTFENEPSFTTTPVKGTDNERKVPGSTATNRALASSRAKMRSEDGSFPVDKPTIAKETPVPNQSAIPKPQPNVRGQKKKEKKSKVLGSKSSVGHKVLSPLAEEVEEDNFNDAYPVLEEVTQLSISQTSIIDRGDDTTSKLSSTFLGKRKYGSSSSTPRMPVMLSRGLPVYEISTELPVNAERKTLPVQKEDVPNLGATVTPKPSRGGNKPVKTPQPVVNNAASKVSKDNTKAGVPATRATAKETKETKEAKRVPLVELPAKRAPAAAAAPAPATLADRYAIPSPQKEDIDVGLDRKSSFEMEDDKKHRKDRQRAALLTLSQQIEELAPQLDDSEDEYTGVHPDEANSATSFADESSIALSRILQELNAFQKPTHKGGKKEGSKLRKQLRNIATSSRDQLRAYVNQVRHYLSFYIKDMEHSLRTNHDTLSYALTGTVQPQVIAQETKSLTEFEQTVLAQFQDISSRHNAFTNAFRDVKTQDAEAVSSFRRSLTQARLAHRSRAVLKLRQPPASVSTTSRALPTAADLRALVSGGRQVDIAALLRG